MVMPNKCRLCAHLIEYYPIRLNEQQSAIPSYKCDVSAYSNVNESVDTYCKFFKLKITDEEKNSYCKL